MVDFDDGAWTQIWWVHSSSIFFFVSFWYLFFLWVCVHNRCERVISRDDHFLGENITFKAFFFCPYCKRKTKTLFLLFFPSIDACKHSWFFRSKHKVFNCTSSPKWAPLMYIFFYIFILNPFFCMICIVLGFRGFKEISESKGRIFFSKHLEINAWWLIMS